MAFEMFYDPEYHGWLTNAEIRDLWEDCPDDDDLLDMLNDSAIKQCEAYAPVLKPTTTDDGITYFPSVPQNYRLAQLAQVKDLYNSSRANPSGDFGTGEFTITPFPMTWRVQALLRPKRGRPLVA
ncbi:hypothetical protein VD659_16200 [Herbiconiux sp. 11R-BC]|uniref:hypothetical protein n=1 Tax=Herbiconiux sp. 11R-BC TaxID=3111637 RepID=UPI003C08BE8C